MGMSGYILDLEEQFDTKVEEAVKQSECVEEAVAEAMKHRSLVAHMTDDEVEEYVYEGWNEIWSNYLQGAPNENYTKQKNSGVVEQQDKSKSA